MILTIDPGGSLKVASLGWCSFEDNGTLVDFGQILPEDLVDLLRTIQPTTLIVENYRNRPWKQKAHNWSDNKTSKCIGACEMWNGMHDNCKLVLQDVNNGITGVMWSGTKMPKDHDLSHQVMAYGHGVFYIIKNKIRTIQSYHNYVERIVT